MEVKDSGSSDEVVNAGDGAEEALRYKTARAMIAAGKLLGLPIITVSTAIMFFQRCFTQVSFQELNPHYMAHACLFVASKVEETHRRLRDIINVMYRLENPMVAPMEVDRAFWDLKAKIEVYEQILMRVLDFQFQVSHVHNYLLHYIRELEATEEVAVISFYLLNDSLCTTLSVRFPPGAIVCAAIYLAAEMTNNPISTNRGVEWWEKFGVKRAQVAEISHRLLDATEFL
jgi:transcription initiation factor TFIIIB Brf1 subunit/transcription initiation factor TFIIB